MLAAEGFEVIIITDETGHLRLLEKRYIATNTVFPKVLNVDDISWGTKNSSNMGFESIKKNYDFILFDIERNQEHIFIDRYLIDLIIIPLNPAHNVNTSLRNAVEFNKRTKANHSRSIVACLLVGITQDYTFDFHYHGLEHYISENELNRLYEKSKRDRLSHERYFTELNSIKKLGIYVFDTYSSDVYKIYENEHVEKHGFHSMGYHFLDEPNTLSAHQLRGIKNEIKRLLSISDNFRIVTNR